MTAEDLPILAAPIRATARRLGCGETKTKELIKRGILEIIHIDKRTLVLQVSVERYIESLRGKSVDGRRNPTAMEKAIEARRQRRREMQQLAEDAE
jgi:hypothetical protein